MAQIDFRLRYARWMRPLLAAVGLSPGRVKVELRDTELSVRAGMWFRAAIPRSSIRAATRQRNAWWAIGVHADFRGGWLVNGSPRGIVLVALDPPARARMAGIRVKVKRLGLSLEDPDGFLEAVAPVRAPLGRGGADR